MNHATIVLRSAVRELNAYADQSFQRARLAAEAGASLPRAHAIYDEGKHIRQLVMRIVADEVGTDLPALCDLLVATDRVLAEWEAGLRGKGRWWDRQRYLGAKHSYHQHADRVAAMRERLLESAHRLVLDVAAGAPTKTPG